MITPKYIQTDDNTVHFSKMVLEKLENQMLFNQELLAKVCTLTIPTNSAQLYNEKEAAKILSMSVKRLYILRKEGKIHYHQDGINIRYSTGNFLEYEENCKR